MLHSMHSCGMQKVLQHVGGEAVFTFRQQAGSSLHLFLIACTLHLVPQPPQPLRESPTPALLVLLPPPLLLPCLPLPFPRLWRHLHHP